MTSERESQETEIQVDEDTPAELVKRAHAQALALTDVAKNNTRQMVAEISGHKYLQLEAWQVLGKFNGTSPVVAWTREVREGEELLGYEARVEVTDVRSGRVVSSAESLCGVDESVARGQAGLARRNAARSMAQTRAASKALRLAYSYIAVMAGYKPTPSSEMAG